MKKHVKYIYMIFLSCLFLMLSGCGKSVEQQITEQLQLGQKYLSEQNYEEAAIAFQKVIDLDPKQIGGYKGLIDVYTQQGKYEMAVSVFRESNTLFENSADDNLETLQDFLMEKLKESAVKLMDSGEFEQAESLYRLMLELDENLPEAILGIVDSLLSQGEFEQAESILGEALEKNPEDEMLKEKKEQFDEGEIKDYKGRVLKSTWYKPDGSLSSYTTYEYDENNNQSKVTYYNGDGSVDSEEYTYYGEDGKREKEERYAAEGYLMSEGSYIEEGVWRITSYNADGTIDFIEEWTSDTCRTYDSEGNLTFYDEREYDEAGRIIKRSSFTADGELTGYWVSEYDEQGNRISYIQYNADGTVDAYLEEE